MWQELCMQNSIPLKNDKMVLPKTLHKKLYHQHIKTMERIEKTKHMLPEEWCCRFSRNVPILLSSHNFIPILTTQAKLHAITSMGVFVPEPMWPVQSRQIHIHCHWCLLQVLQGCTSKGHIFKNINKRIKVNIFQWC